MSHTPLNLPDTRLRAWLSPKGGEVWALEASSGVFTGPVEVAVGNRDGLEVGRLPAVLSQENRLATWTIPAATADQWRTANVCLLEVFAAGNRVGAGAVVIEPRWSTASNDTTRHMGTIPLPGPAGSGSSGAGAAGVTAAQKLAAELEMGGSVTLAVASDSTANDGNDWVAVWARMEAARPGLRVEYISWDAAASAYRAPVILAEGDTTPASGGTVLADDFNRTAAELVGSRTSGGQTWTGKAGGWSANGSAAVCSAIGYTLAFDTGQREGAITATLNVVTTKPSAPQQLRIFKSSSNSNSQIWLGVSLSTSGAVSVSLWCNIAGVSRQLGATVSPALTIDSAAPQQLTVTIEQAIQNLTASVTVGQTTQTITGQITEAEYQQLGGIGGANPGSLATTAFALDSITMTTPAVAGGAASRVLRVINAAVAGATLDFQRARMGEMFPASTPIDVMVIAGGHNNRTESPETFLSVVEALVADVARAHPETRILISSQNPQYPPAANPAAHAARQRGLRLWATARGHAYLPAFEAFSRQPDRGRSLVSADGVHPTTPPGGTPTEGYGATLWAAALRDLLT